jgi:carbamoyl-phosphate synthase large subunit
MANISTSVLIAGIGGASLGTEILKCLMKAEKYTIFGCDISPYAYGHYQKGFAQTFLADRDRYVESVLEICVAHGIRAIVPGGEEPMVLLGPHTAKFQASGISIVGNSPEIIATCSDKQRLFECLKELKLPVPRTVAVRDVNALDDFPCPCVIKPATGTGGSCFVFLASDQDEANLYLRYILANCNTALVQEYIPLDEGEFTIGVLSLPDGRIVGSIAIQRLFHAKLSVLAKTKGGLISSGYSQGLINEFSEVCAQAERIAKALGSTGPINIQGRVRNGILLPFEINPRFSASTYLRDLAGFNEIDIYLQYVLYGTEPVNPQIHHGYYLRSLSEVFVPKEAIKQ